MSMDHNLVSLSGRLVKPVELKTAANGNAFLNNTIAVACGKDKEGDELTLFMDFSAFGKTSETIGGYLKKGDYLTVTGELFPDSWHDSNTGQKRTATKMKVSRMSFVPGQKKESRNDGGWDG